MTGREERPYFPSSCPIALAGAASAVALVGYGLFVVISDVVQLFA